VQECRLLFCTASNYNQQMCAAILGDLLALSMRFIRHGGNRVMPNYILYYLSGVAARQCP